MPMEFDLHLCERLKLVWSLAVSDAEFGLTSVFTDLCFAFSDWLLGGQKDIWDSPQGNSGKPEHLWSAFGCFCKGNSLCLALFLCSLCHSTSVIFLFLGRLGSNCSCVWERSHLSRRGSSDNNSECQLRNVSWFLAWLSTCSSRKILTWSRSS